MSSTDAMVIGTGTLAGAAAGYAVGKAKGEKLLAPINEAVLNAVKLNQTKDEYVTSRVEANIEKVHTLKKSKWEKQFAKIREKAAQDYEKINFEEIGNIIKKSKNAPFKYSAILAMAGLALGAIATLFTKKD